MSGQTGQSQEQTRNIALVVIDAVSSSIDEDPDVAQPNIEKLAQSPVIGTRYWLNDMNLYPNPGSKEYDEEKAMECPYLKCVKKSEDPQKEALKHVAGTATDIILAGGSLRNEHYDAFHFIMAGLRRESRIADIHMPLDCTYSFSQHYDSGESWTQGELGSLEMPVVKAYQDAMRSIATPGCMTKVDGQVVEQSPVATLHLWSTAAKMLEYLAAAPKR